MSLRSRVWEWRFAALGVLAAIAACELAIRIISTPMPVWWDRVDISADGTDSVAFTLKWYHEGVATSHFSAATARLTGNRFLPGAPVGVIMGDSYVQAIQIDDHETMGAVVERLARSSSTLLNVRQFGWSQAAPATYVARGPDVLRRWNPAWVVVVLNAQDLVPRALSDPPVSRVASDTSLEIVGPLVPVTPLTGWHDLVRDASQFASRFSVLAWEGFHRLSLIRHTTPGAAASASLFTPMVATEEPPRVATGQPSLGMIAAASVRSLHRIFGDRLIIVYVPTVTATSAPIEPEETALFTACHDQDVTCASTRDAMIALRDRRARLARGFANTVPGIRQHTNALGHEVIGEAIWQLVAQRTERALHTDSTPLTPP